MPASRSRGPSIPADDGLRLPRPPGVLRRFLARHQRLGDILVALLCLLAALLPALSFGSLSTAEGDSGTTVPVLVWRPVHLLALAVSVLLVWRRRWPVATLAASVVLAATAMLAASPSLGAALLVAAYTLAVERSSRVCWTALAIGIGALAALAAVLAGTGAIARQTAIDAVAVDLVLALLGALVGVNVANRRRYLEAIIDRSRQLLVERDQRAQLAAAEERTRIAREMHDIVSHALTVVVALSEGAAATEDSERARDAMDSAAATARVALTEMRAMLGVLRAGDSAAPLAPLAPATPAEVVDAARRAGYPVTLTLLADSAVPDAVRYAVGRIVQEGVTNAMRHAHASRIGVRVDYAARPVAIEIENDGAHGEPSGEGFGLRGLRERVALVGGTIESGPSGDGRWLLRAELPVRPPGTDGADGAGPGEVAAMAVTEWPEAPAPAVRAGTA